MFNQLLKRFVGIISEQKGNDGDTKFKILLKRFYQMRNAAEICRPYLLKAVEKG